MTFHWTQTEKVTFSYTGAEQTWTVPSHVEEITVYVRGAGAVNSANGGLVVGTLSVTPGETLYIYVGGETGFNGGAGNGGGNATNGGGASDIRQGGNAVADQAVVAGGAGGRGDADGDDCDCSTGGGSGGPLVGASAGDCRAHCEGDASCNGGSGGNQDGTSGSGNRLGGSGGSSDGNGWGGGGGGGYYGGQGGGAGEDTSGGGFDSVYAGCGGGGGSSYVDQLNQVLSNIRGENDGNGEVIIEYPMG